jgi:hypothetical protein
MEAADGQHGDSGILRRGDDPADRGPRGEEPDGRYDQTASAEEKQKEALRWLEEKGFVREVQAKEAEQEAQRHGADDESIGKDDPSSKGGRVRRPRRKGSASHGRPSFELPPRQALAGGSREESLHERLSYWAIREGCLVTDRWAVIQADCRDVLPTIGHADHCITDPPYSEFVHRAVAKGDRTRMPDVSRHACRIRRVTDLGFPFLDKHLRRLCAAEFSRIVRRWTMVFSDVEFCHYWREDFLSFRMHYVRTMAFVPEAGAPQFSGDRPARAFEAIVLGHTRHKKRWNGGGKPGLYVFPVVMNSNGHRGDRVHTTQKPVELMMSLVRDFTDPDDVILDPFAGSGTTGLAAIRLGRRCIMIEQKPEYAAICIDRMRAEDQQSTLTAYRAGQMPLLWAR